MYHIKLLSLLLILFKFQQQWLNVLSLIKKLRPPTQKNSYVSIPFFNASFSIAVEDFLFFFTSSLHLHGIIEFFQDLIFQFLLLLRLEIVNKQSFINFHIQLVLNGILEDSCIYFYKHLDQQYLYLPILYSWSSRILGSSYQ